MAEEREQPSAFGHYGETEHVSGNWAAALLTSSVLYVLIGIFVLVIGAFTKKMVIEPEPVDVTFVEKVVKEVVPPSPAARSR